jgi:hypothetical protein
MASTYVNDLRLNEMATGDGSGTWGTTTNTNLELIAEAFSYGTEAITTNADTHTTTIADGATDPGRALYLKYTGTLDSACTITIGPDTVSKVWIIENGTSGSQNIIISQGSGANITIPAGDTKVVYSDGAGAGAAFVDAFASLSVVDLKVQDDLTVTDDASIGGDATITGTLGVTGNITGTLATAAQPNITSVGTLTGFTSTGIDDNADATAITIDSSENVGIGTASPTSRLQLDGAEDRTGGLTLSAGGQNHTYFLSSDFVNVHNIETSSGAAAHTWQTNSTERLRIDSSGNLLVGKTSNDLAVNGVKLGTTGVNVTRDNDVMVLNRTSSDGLLLGLWKDGTAVGSIGSRSSGANLYIALRTETAGDGCGLTGSDSSTGAILASDGNGAITDNHIDLGAPAVRFKDLYLSGGVYLGGTGAANLLDDYEEGTWTPTLVPHAGTAPTISTTNAGTYTKVGRLVTVTGYIQVDSISGVTSGIVNIGPLPFAGSTVSGYIPAGAIVNNGTTFARPDNANITLYDASYAGLLTSNNGVGWNWETFAIFSATDAFRFSLAYYTS